MFVRFSALLLLLVSPAFAQQPVYKDFELDSIAGPRGGMTHLNAFLQTNLRKPIAAEAEGIGGRVILTGVVEPNGHISDVSVMKGIRPDLDREALRVFSLYNAWKPGKKGSQTVRQVVTIPVMFPKNEPFSYVNGAKVGYYDADSKLVTDSTQARYKQVAPIDSAGMPSGDVVIYEKKGKNWRESNRLPLTRGEKLYRFDIDKQVYRIGCQNANLQWEGLVVEMDDQDNRVQQVYYQDGKRVSDELRYYDNGVVAERRELAGEKELVTNWYSTGQIEQVRTSATAQLTPTSPPDQTTALWDTAGVMLVNNGNGQAIHQRLEKSLKDTTAHTLFTEQGRYENGFKQGDWTGRYADGSFVYDEKYDKGVCLGGSASRAGSKPEPYKVLQQNPTFPGGMSGLGKFLSENLHYPVNAQKAGVQGKVFVRFVVCTDGTLCDYEVVKGVHPDVDSEAMRVVKKMSGRWEPGVQRGKKVRVQYNLPINFSLY